MFQKKTKKKLKLSILIMTIEKIFLLIDQLAKRKILKQMKKKGTRFIILTKKIIYKMLLNPKSNWIQFHVFMWK